MALRGKVAVVTGAARGLGKSFSKILLNNGAKVSLLDLDEVAGEETKIKFDEIYGADRTIFSKVDITLDDQFKDGLKKTVEFFGGMDIFCNNAGIGNEKNWEKMVSINLNGMIRGTYLALNHMKKENGGRGGVIINIASLAGLGPLVVSPVYTATKHGVVGFSRAMAGISEVAGYGVRLNVLCPGFAQTDILSDMQDKEKTGQYASLKGLTEKYIEEIGIMEVTEVAKAFLLLVMDESKNGEVLMTTKDESAFMLFPKTTSDAPRITVSL